MPEQVSIFGIRHHGPGSARSLLRALDQLRPQCVLIEGPPDADEMIPYAAKAEMKPPVAILVHAVETPQDAVYYPFAEFSPEWQAMRWALTAGMPVRFMDLPQWHRIPIEAEQLRKLREEVEAKAAAEASGESTKADDADPEKATPTAPPDQDPLGQLAKSAGFDDGERWWEHVVEHNRNGDLGIFLAIKDAMAELRQGRTAPRDADEPLREAWMRRTIREARKEGFENIAVVCGAWHAPALDVDATTKKQDDQSLAGLPKTKTSATWVPWTHDLRQRLWSRHSFARLVRALVEARAPHHRILDDPHRHPAARP